MMNAHTGRMMSEREHIRQSIADILFTRFGTRIQREQYGSIIPELIDSPISGETLMLTIASGVFMALATYEPRITVKKVLAKFIESSGLTLQIEYILNNTNETMTEQVSHA